MNIPVSDIISFLIPILFAIGGWIANYLCSKGYVMPDWVKQFYKDLGGMPVVLHHIKRVQKSYTVASDEKKRQLVASELQRIYNSKFGGMSKMPDSVANLIVEFVYNNYKRLSKRK